MKIAAIIVRTLMGLLFLFASITYFFKFITPPPAEGAMKVFGDGLEASVYIMPTVKVIELICGLAFVTGRFDFIVRLACKDAADLDHTVRELRNRGGVAATETRIAMRTSEIALRHQALRADEP